MNVSPGLGMLHMPAARDRWRSLEEQTLCGAFQVTIRERAADVALRARRDAFSMTWGEYGEKVRAIAAGLAALGVKRGHSVALMLVNRPEFHWVDTAAMHLGAIPFSLHNTSSVDEIERVLIDAGSRIVVTEDAFVTTVLEACERVGSVDHVLVKAIADTPKAAGSSCRSRLATLDELEQLGEPSFDFEAAWRAVRPDDLVTLSYTSGSTGEVKAVEVTHANHMAATRSFAAAFAVPRHSRLVSYLPMAHTGERTITHYHAMVFGFAVTTCPDVRQVLDYLPDVRPTWFFSVPLIFERLRRRIQAALKAESASAVRKRVGLDSAALLHVGGAAASRDLLRFFHSAGLPLVEVWGLSEMCGFPTVQVPDRIKVGTVGLPCPGVELRLADDGELLLRSRGVMRGYRNRPAETRAVIDAEGWLHTGDIGEFDEDGFLRIVARKKELIVSSAGKNISPAPIEAQVRAGHPVIAHAVCIGDARPYNVALIVLDLDVARAVAGASGEPASPARLAADPAVFAAVQQGVHRANSQLPGFERIRHFHVLGKSWHPGGDELTPTMKVRRHEIDKKYRHEIEQLYAG